MCMAIEGLGMNGGMLYAAKALISIAFSGPAKCEECVMKWGRIHIH